MSPHQNITLQFTNLTRSFSFNPPKKNATPCIKVSRSEIKSDQHSASRNAMKSSASKLKLHAATFPSSRKKTLSDPFDF